MHPARAAAHAAHVAVPRYMEPAYGGAQPWPPARCGRATAGEGMTMAAGFVTGCQRRKRERTASISTGSALSARSRQIAPGTKLASVRRGGFSRSSCFPFASRARPSRGEGLRGTSSRGERPLRRRPGGARDLPGPSSQAWPSRSPFRRARVPRLSRMRRAGSWLPPPALRPMRLRPPGPLLVQGPLLPLLRWAAHGRHRRPPRRSRPSRGPRAPVGALAPVFRSATAWPTTQASPARS